MSHITRIKTNVNFKDKNVLEAALKELEKDPNFKTPVIALTADAIQGSQEKYIQEGFADYIAKPFSKDQIKAKIDRLLKK